MLQNNFSLFLQQSDKNIDQLQLGSLLFHKNTRNKKKKRKKKITWTIALAELSGVVKMLKRQVEKSEPVLHYRDPEDSKPNFSQKTTSWTCVWRTETKDVYRG